VRPDDAVQIQYTSGTTGFPKGAMLHHRGATNNARLYARRLHMDADDVQVNPMPLFHTAGCMMAVLGCCQSGARLVPVVAFEPGLVLELIEVEGGTGFCGVPTMLAALLEHPDRRRRDLSSIRVAVSGGSLVPEPLARRVEAELGAPMCIVFGTTECSPLISVVAPEDAEEDRFTTLGRPMPQTEVKVGDPRSGEPVPVGETGELCCRGYNVMLGYHDMPEATAEAIDPEGWYHTGDLASMDSRGYLRVEGRIKDMIIRGGENIYPREIEERLAAHPGVGDVAVVGVPDARWGEIVAAVIRPSSEPPPSVEELRAWCRDALAAYKTPAVWSFAESLPLTASGKIQKYVLRGRLVEELSGSG
jgi:fatty-acyl-CoA synthase